MKNQTSGKGGASPKIQAMKGPTSKTVGGKGPAADSSKGKSAVSAGAGGPSGGSGAMAPDSVKGGHN
jgi:hypothetical protein